MPRPRNSIPKYSVSKTGRAFTKVSGQFVSLGTDGPEARLKYAGILEKLSGGHSLDSATASASSPARSLSVNELCLAFNLHAKSEYIDAVTGKPSAEVDCFKSAIRPVRELFGLTPAAEFGPNKLRAVREQYIANGWSRGYINKSVCRIRHVWKWGISHEMVPAHVLEGLRSLQAIKPGKTKAKETRRRRAVPREHIEAVKLEMKPRNRDLVDLLLLTGARPSEILCLTTAMIQSRTTVDGVWLVPLEHHKNRHHGHDRTIYFNAAAQAIVTKYIKLDAPDDRLFKISRVTLGRVIRKACIDAGVPEFTSHWLRHTAGTSLANHSGAEAAQRVLGHSTLDMTANYTLAAERQAVEAIKHLG